MYQLLRVSKLLLFISWINETKPFSSQDRDLYFPILVDLENVGNNCETNAIIELTSEFNETPSFTPKSSWIPLKIQPSPEVF